MRALISIRPPGGPRLLPLLLSLLATGAGFAATSSDAAAHESARVQELEREVAELRSLVERLLDAQAAPDGAQTQPSATAAQEQEILPPSQDIPPTEPDELSLPTLAVRGFGDVSYSFRHRDPTTGSSKNKNDFSLGDLDLLVTSQIASRLSFLNETLLEFEDNDDVRVDVERLLLKYQHADWLGVSVGRGHTGVGYYNTRFHHAAWLQTTVERPLFFQFDEEGGFLPTHFVGFEAMGAFGLEPGTLSYWAIVANGRARESTEVQNIGDANNEKQISTMFTFEPAFAPGFALGANGLYDRIPSDRDQPGRAGEMDELIGGLHAYYLTYPYEALLEWQYIYHHDDRTEQSYHHHGGYAQIAYGLGDVVASLRNVKPYYRFDWMGFEAGDPYYQTLTDAQDTTQHTVGVRYDWKPFAAIKLEYRGKKAETENTDTATIQFSFVF